MAEPRRELGSMRRSLTDDMQTWHTEDVYQVNEFAAPVGKAIGDDGLEVS